MLKIGVVFGGISEEHEVSLAGANGVLSAFSELNDYEALPIGISKDGQWCKGDDALYTLAKLACDDMLFIDPEKLPHKGTAELNHNPPIDYIKSCDYVMLLTHGRLGEDGRLQGFFETLGTPIIGCNVLASAKCFDKALLKTILAGYGYNVSPGIDIILSTTHITEDFYNDICKKLDTQKMVIKPVDNGSSIGLSFANNYEEFKQGINVAAEVTDHVVIEKYIIHQEIVVGVIGEGDDVVVSDLGELADTEETDEEFLSYEDKYIKYDPLSFPANVSPEVAAELEKQALEIYTITKCSGWARVDFFVEAETDKIYLNEINTIPGMSKPSFFPQVFASKGLDYTTLIRTIVDKAVKAKVGNVPLAKAS